MNSFLWSLLLWLLAFAIPVFMLLGAGLLKVNFARRSRSVDSSRGDKTSIEMVVPIKGVVPNQERILLSLLNQDYESYRVVFVVESDEDPANELLDELIRSHPHARKIVGGKSLHCAQKNYNLVKGVNRLEPDTEIIVFCDSTNAASSDWLRHFSQPIRLGQAQAVTTFRIFHPVPQSMAGVCQTMYGTLVLLLSSVAPRPWGGATAILRRTFEELDVVSVWSRTVVDDLVLGNILEKNAVRIVMEPCSTLESPIWNQTVQGFLSYLDRQIMFPKYTNPWIWLGLLILYLNFAATFVVTTAVIGLSVMGLVKGMIVWISIAFVLAIGVLALVIRWNTAHHISLTMWSASVFPLLFFGAFIFLRSIFRNHIEWHGRIYRCGAGGTILSVDRSGA